MSRAIGSNNAGGISAGIVTNPLVGLVSESNLFDGVAGAASNAGVLGITAFGKLWRELTLGCGGALLLGGGSHADELAEALDDAGADKF